MRPAKQRAISEAAWKRVLARDPRALRAAPLYSGLLEAAARVRGTFVLGRLAQSLDGRIAAEGGRSFWISGEADQLHAHRLRALSEAIVVGAGTVRADDPQLTTRHCHGPSPRRVVIDTDRRLASHYRVFTSEPPTLLVCAEDAADAPAGNAEVLRLPRHGPGLDIGAIIAALAARGLNRILVEGGGITLSRFLAAGQLDRLHLTVAPLLLGSGVPAFTLPGVSQPVEGLRCAWTVHPLGQDVLFDIALERQPMEHRT